MDYILFHNVQVGNNLHTYKNKGSKHQIVAYFYYQQFLSPKLPPPPSSFPPLPLPSDYLDMW